MPDAGSESDPAEVVAESGRRLLADVAALMQSEGYTPATCQQVAEIIYNLQSEIGRGASAAATTGRALLGYSGGAAEAEERGQAGQEGQEAADPGSDMRDCSEYGSEYGSNDDEPEADEVLALQHVDGDAAAAVEVCCPGG